MIQRILEQGDPVLLQMSEEVTPEALATPEIQQVINDLVQTLKSTTGAGLAAPQIGKLLRIVAVADPLAVLVNPILTPIGDEMATSYEGCLSVPGLRGEVQRHRTVRVQALGSSGQVIDTVWTNARATVVQHEVDHLNGILYTERAAFTFPDDTVHPPALPPDPDEGQRRATDGSRKTLVVQSPHPVGGTQQFSWIFHQRGRVVELRVSPGGAIVTGVWLAGVRLRAREFKAGSINERVIGPGLHVLAGEQLRVELRMPKGKRKLVAEADFYG